MNDSENQNHELVIGLVSAVGTESKRAIDVLKERLGLAGYNVHHIKVSQDVIPRIKKVETTGLKSFDRLMRLMDAGNSARSTCEDNSILAIGAAAAIFAMRHKDKDGNPLPKPKSAYVIDSLKRPEEVATLRLIYPAGFVLVGVHAEPARRVHHLSTDRGMSKDEAQTLIDRDGDERSDKFGQRVNNTFHMADFFVQISSSQDQLRSDLERMVALWFGNPYITPTFDEHAMFMAFGAALRSADLSRQVGAVIARDSQILATGANDTPRAGGGLYWPSRDRSSGRIEDHPDGRDFMRQCGDSNQAEKEKIIGTIVDKGAEAQFGFDKEKLRWLLTESPLRDLTEYGRVVHAEMEALLCCSRNGLSTVGATLFSTTFPCHNCAKHIVAAGIKRVVYVEPYPKSKALAFHSDSVEMADENEEKMSGKVRFEPFVGIGPRRFFDLFSMHLSSSYGLVRKESDGKRVNWRIESSQLRINMRPMSYLEFEADAARTFSGKLPEANGDGERNEREGVS